MYDFIIIGAGITGTTLARLLQMQNKTNFIVLEAEQEPGGLCKTKKIGDHYLDIGGGHFLCSKHPEIYEFIFSHMPKENFNYFNRVSKISIGGDVVDYPLESNLWQMSNEKQKGYLDSIKCGGESLGKPEPVNYEEWVRWRLGDFIANNYMIPYNKKLWGVDPKEMDIDWLHKIPTLNTKEIFKSCLNKKSDKSKFPSHINFYYPKHEGFQLIFDSIYKFISSNVILGEPVINIEYKGDHWIINNKHKAKNIINTAPWPDLYKALGSPDNLKDDFEKLKYNTLVVSLWEKKYDNDWHWRYIPDLNIENHREFYINNFAPHSKKNGLYT